MLRKSYNKSNCYASGDIHKDIMFKKMIMLHLLKMTFKMNNMKVFQIDLKQK